MVRLWLSLLCVLPACTPRRPGGGSTALVVGAPPALRGVFEAAQRAFEKAQGTDSLHFMFAAPEALATSGVPFDAVAVEQGSGLTTLAALAPEGGKRWRYARDPVCVVAALGKAPLPRWSQLADAAEVAHVLVADPRGAHATGALAEAAMGRAGVRARVAAKVAYVGTVEAALERALAQGNEVALARPSDVARAPARDKLRLGECVDEVPAGHTLALAPTSTRAAEVEQLANILLGEEAQSQLAHLGYLKP